MQMNRRTLIGKYTSVLQSAREEIGKSIHLGAKYTLMNRLPPIGNASFEKYTSLSKTIISSFYGQLINATIYLSESDFSTVFRFTTFEEFNDLNSF